MKKDINFKERPIHTCTHTSILNILFKVKQNEQPVYCNFSMEYAIYGRNGQRCSEKEIKLG